MNRIEILETALQCVTKDRNATHGEPEDNFQLIADYWNTFLKPVKPITPHEVAVMMIFVKLARISISPEHDDHWVDIAGYAACGGGCVKKAES